MFIDLLKLHLNKVEKIDKLIKKRKIKKVIFKKFRKKRTFIEITIFK